MKLGMLTACLPGWPLDRIAEFAAEQGYERLEVGVWPGTGGRDFEAAHLPVATFTESDAAQTRELLDRTGLEISAFAYYENNLHHDPETREATHDHLRRCIDAAQLLGCGLVGTFVGRDVTLPVRDNLRLAEEVVPPLVEYAAARGVRLVVENCPMGRQGDPEIDIGPLAWFLCSDACRYLTGHTFMADGGAFMWA